MSGHQGWVVINSDGEEEGIDLTSATGSTTLREPSKPVKEFSKSKDARLKALRTSIEHLESLVNQIDFPEEDHLFDMISKLKSKVDALDKTSIMLLGEGKVGKSALLNCMLGKCIVPATNSMGFSLVYEILSPPFGSDEAVLVYLKQSALDLQGVGLPDWIEQHLRTNDWSQPIIFQTCIQLQNQISTQETNIIEMYKLVIDHVEIRSNHPILATGLRFFDCPDISDQDEIGTALERYMSQTDLLIFFTTPQSIGSEKEIRFVDKIQNFFDFKDLYFVCTKFETSKNATETLTSACQVLSSRSPDGMNGVHFMSFLHLLHDFYLKSIIRPENEGLIASSKRRLLSLEESMFRFLTTKIAARSRSLTYEIVVAGSKCKEELTQLKDMLKMTPEQVQAIVLELEPKVTKLQVESDDTIAQLRQEVQFELSRIQDEAENFLSSLVREIPQIALASKPKSAMSLLSAFTEYSWKVYCREVSILVREELGSRIGTWIHEHLRPSVESFVRQMEDRMGEKMSRKFIELDNIKLRIRQGESYVPIVTEDYESSTMIERLWSTTGLAKDVAGFVGLYQTLAPLFGTSLLAQVATYSTVFLSTTVTLSSMMSSLIGKSEDAESFIKQKVSSSMEEAMKAHVKQAAQDIALTFKDFLNGSVQKLEIGIQSESRQIVRNLRRAYDLQAWNAEDLSSKRSGLELLSSSVFHFLIGLQDTLNADRKLHLSPTIAL
eukprot:TRINITY_DN393_c0_g1_i4.p1 TRINITY_DN393_c0_g1~~TRINITY_DN393_c0_g1_i4.p1  ORF type:complete len:722 (-),score=153.59 TRINITY_DN393_c0_g1_i4:273-2438(-)